MHSATVLAPRVEHFPDLLLHEKRKLFDRHSEGRVLSTLVYILLQKQKPTQDKVSYALTLRRDAIGPMYALREQKVFDPLFPHECLPVLINACVLISLPDCPCPRQSRTFLFPQSRFLSPDHCFSGQAQAGLLITVRCTKADLIVDNTNGPCRYCAQSA